MIRPYWKKSFEITERGRNTGTSSAERRASFGLLDEDLECVRDVSDVLLGLLGAGVKIVVRQQADDGAGEAHGRRDERLSHTTRDLTGGGTDVTGSERAERAHHARNRAEQTEERGSGDA